MFKPLVDIPDFLPAPVPHSNFELRLRNQTLNLRPGSGVVVMGILNLTPDSFYDGGKYMSVDAAVERVEQMIAEGASIIDIGGASSRPAGTTYAEGALLVPEDEELERLIPTIESVRSKYEDLIISVDTFRSAVAARALDSGADIVNDITGLRFDPELATVVAEHQAALILMHSVGTPGDMPHESHYLDVVTEVGDSLAASVDIATQAGVDKLVVDPGFGFGKTVADNLKLVNSVDTLLGLGRPVLVGVSRKSTIGVILSEDLVAKPPEERLFGSLGTSAVAVMRGATIVRTHDVAETSQMLRALTATRRARRAS